MDIENIITIIAIIIIIIIIYRCLYRSKVMEGFGKAIKSAFSTVSGAGSNVVKSGTDIVNKVNDLSSKLNNSLQDVNKIFDELKELKKLPSLIEDGFENVEKIPKVIDNLVNQVKNNLDIVDRLIDPLEDLLNDINDTIMNTIAELTDHVNFALSEIGSLKAIFQNFGINIADIFISIFDIILKIIYFIGGLPSCLIWYIIDAYENLMKLIVPKWAQNIWNFFKNILIIPLMTIFSWILSLFGYDFNIDNNRCYKLDIKDEERKLKKAFSNLGNLFKL